MGKLLQSGGVAWAYRQYVKDRSLLEIEAGPRARKVGSLGIAGAQRTPPWDSPGCQLHLPGGL
jgi:hypothetical protein